jgi:SAM-dependent methyltransferase
VRLSPRPLIKHLSFYYPEEEYYSYQHPVRWPPPLADGWRAKLKASIRDSVMDWKGYSVPDMARWQSVLQPLLAALLHRRIPYGFGDSLPHYSPGHRALEIGCGSGSVLGFLKYYGWQVAGVELSEVAAIRAKSELDIDVFVGDLCDAPFEPNSFDFIRMSHVIEHLPEPLETLRMVARLLKPGGTVYIETPNVNSFACKKFGRHWFAWEAPRHLYLFTPATLERTVTAAGLKMKELRTSTHEEYLWAEVFRREERDGCSIPNRPRFPASPDFGPGIRFRHKVFRLKARMAHLLNPLDGDFIHCWATRQDS